MVKHKYQNCSVWNPEYKFYCQTLTRTTINNDDKTCILCIIFFIVSILTTSIDTAITTVNWTAPAANIMKPYHTCQPNDEIISTAIAQPTVLLNTKWNNNPTSPTLRPPMLRPHRVAIKVTATAINCTKN